MEEKNKFIEDIARSLRNIEYYTFVYLNAKNEKDKYYADNILSHEFNHVDVYFDYYCRVNNITAKEEKIKLCKEIKHTFKIKYKKQLKQMIKEYKESGWK
jgi:hypothetical protein